MSDTVTSIDCATAKQIGDAAEQALQEVATRFGLSLERKGGRYDPAAGTFAPKFEFSVEGSEELAFAADARFFGLLPGDYKAVFLHNGTRFEVVGINRRARRLPIIARELGGARRKFKFTAEAVASAINRPVS